MGAIRNRFNTVEREGFVEGAQVEYLHGNRWYPGVVRSGIKTDTTGQSYVELERTHELTPAMLAGPFRGYPKHLRLVGKLTEQQCKELYETWRLLYGTYGDRAGAHLVWLGVDPDRLEEVARYVRGLRSGPVAEGLTASEAVYCRRVDAEMLEGFAKECREENG